MKRMIIAVVVVGALFTGLAWYANRPSARAVAPPEPVAEATPAPSEEKLQVVETAAPQPEPKAQPIAVAVVAKPASNTATASVNSALQASLLSQTVETLVSAQASHDQKQDAWKYLGDAGKLDQAIAELEKRIAGDPSNAVSTAALGHAYLHKCGTIKDVREQGILAMQADKMFDTSLGLDASNWDARFMKAVALSYWPPMLNKGDEVIQHFTTLIEQQEAQAPQPHFAETYAWLGDQYQKANRADDAKTIWQRGITLFPANEKLRTKLASAQ
jgi:tetratricopeptide (TPR) repeat protein